MMEKARVNPEEEGSLNRPYYEFTIRDPQYIHLTHSLIHSVFICTASQDIVGKNTLCRGTHHHHHNNQQQQQWGLKYLEGHSLNDLKSRDA